MGKHKLYVLISLELLISNLSAGGTIVGFVQDSAATGIENAIVYFSNTYYGCSTDSFGYFSLIDVPDGHYWLMVSKAGYIRKEVDVEISGSDTSHLIIILLARPIELEGVDIWADSLTYSNPWKSVTGLFIPGNAEHTYTVFNSSGKIPFGLLQLDTITILYSIDTIIYNENCLIRFWILYANFSDQKQQFNPMHSLTLTIVGRQESFQDITPIPYQQMKTIISNDDVINEIDLRIGGEISNQSGAHAEIWERNRRALKLFDFHWGRSLGILNPLKQRALFASTDKAGILKPYYIHPRSAVQGYVYFLFPLQPNQDVQSIRLNEFRYFITLELNMAVHTLSFGVN